MSMSSPIWLIALVPWLALVIWLLWGVRRRERVPFLPLWQGPIEGPRTRRSVRPPPAIVLALCAALLAMLAAARPRIDRITSSDRGSVGVILDRGIGMSARGSRGLRFRETADEVASVLRAQVGDCPIDLLTVPGGAPHHIRLSQLEKLVHEAAPTAVDAPSMLTSAIAEQLTESVGPVVVITDQQPPIEDPRLIVVVPRSLPRDVGITGLVARRAAIPQVMVTVFSHSPAQAALIRISSAGHQVEKSVDLPGPGARRNFFIDLPELGQVISAELEVHDSVDADKRAWLVREGTAPRIEPHAVVSPELRRLIGAYQRARPPSDGSTLLPIAASVTGLPKDGPGVVRPEAGESISGGIPQAAHHPVTDHVDWEHFPGPIRFDGNAPAGWERLVWIDNRVLVAAHPGSPKQVWVGFDAPAWTGSADFVIFWTNVFDWTGEGGEMFASHSMDEWTSEWQPADGVAAGLWPGLYHRGDGALRAFNTPQILVASDPLASWRQRLASLPILTGRGMDVTHWAAVAAVACAGLAVLIWGRHRARIAQQETDRAVKSAHA